MDFNSELSKIASAYKGSIELIDYFYDSKNFGNFIVKLHSDNVLFRIVNDRGELYVDKYNEVKDEWDHTEFRLYGVTLDSAENAIRQAINFILH